MQEPETQEGVKKEEQHKGEQPEGERPKEEPEAEELRDGSEEEESKEQSEEEAKEAPGIASVLLIKLRSAIFTEAGRTFHRHQSVLNELRLPRLHGRTRQTKVVLHESCRRVLHLKDAESLRKKSSLQKQRLMPECMRLPTRLSRKF